ncbi:unnamed protein product [Durusdinium trenchii]|uniref:Uncharacterized protein n=2 Tax=Durusdinium trenchii TaxID=1381693 RepID=A0ABP0H6S3_9DINO
MVVPGTKRYLSRIAVQPRVYSRFLDAPAGTESIGYGVNESAQHVDYFDRIGLFSKSFTQSIWLSFGAMRWLLLVLIGLGAGLVAVAVELSLHYLLEEKLKLLDLVGRSTESLGAQYLCDIGFCLCAAAIAGILVCFVEVLAAGSGIPEIKCFLNGIHLPKLVSGKTLFAKAVGIVFSVVAGLPCGKEGPMIHSGAIVGAMVTCFNLERRLRPLNLDVETRDFVAAGAAAGVSAAFGAPIGAVLFAVEEGASHMSPRILTQLFVSSSVATLVTRLTLGPIISGHPWSLLGTGVPVSFGRFTEVSYNFLEMFIFALIGIVCGLLGAAFNHFNGRLSRWRKRCIGPTGWKRFFEVLCVTFIIASLKFWIPSVVLGMNGEGWQPLIFDELSQTQQLWLEGGQASIRDLFHCKNNATESSVGVHLPHQACHRGFHELGVLILFGFFNLATTCWTFGLGVPAGLFVPSLLTGAVLGRFVGEVLQAELPQVVGPADPGIYALVGACAMLAGVGRITISLAMILTEATGTGIFGLPIFMVVVIATWVGDYFNRGIYDLHIIDLKQIPLLEQSPADVMVRYAVKDIMASQVVSLQGVEKVQRIVDVLRSCNHNGFPVLENGTMKMEGLIERGFLHLLLARGRYYGMFQDTPDAPIGSLVPFEAIAWPNIHSYPDIKSLSKKLSTEDRQKYMDLRPYVSCNGYSIPPQASMASAFLLFRRLGLRHLPVVDSDGDLCGIITRKDLILMEEDEHGEMVQRSQPKLSADTGWAFRKSENLEESDFGLESGMNSALDSLDSEETEWSQELSVPAVEIVGPNGAPQSSDSDATEKDFEVQSHGGMGGMGA